jgi:hypothetical protein
MMIVKISVAMLTVRALNLKKKSAIASYVCFVYRGSILIKSLETL